MEEILGDMVNSSLNVYYKEGLYGQRRFVSSNVGKGVIGVRFDKSFNGHDFKDNVYETISYVFAVGSYIGLMSININPELKQLATVFLVGGLSFNLFEGYLKLEGDKLLKNAEPLDSQSNDVVSRASKATLTQRITESLATSVLSATAIKVGIPIVESFYDAALRTINSSEIIELGHKVEEFLKHINYSPFF